MLSLQVGEVFELNMPFSGIFVAEKYWSVTMNERIVKDSRMDLVTSDAVL